MEDKYGRILVVDDNKDIHEDIRYILDSVELADDYLETRLLKEELFGEETDGDKFLPGIRYNIDDAYQGEEAIRMVENALEENDPYALIFMDVRMPPGMDGIKAIEEIWKLERDTEVVICTAYSDYSWEQILSKLGQNDHLLFIRKPFDSVSVKQIALTMITKWKLQRQNKIYIGNLELEVEKRTRELNMLVDKLTAEIALREEKEKLLAHIAHYDPLTELLNRRSFYSVLSSVTGSGTPLKEGFSLFFLDMDDFKEVNDALGHDIGDMLLVEFSSRLREMLAGHAFNTGDLIPDSDFPGAVFRLGGDEFTALMAGCDRPGLARIADALMNRIKEPYLISGNVIKISCSMGISVYPEDSETVDMLLKYADVALYEAKKTDGAYLFYKKPEDLKLLDR